MSLYKERCQLYDAGAKQWSTQNDMENSLMHPLVSLEAAVASNHMHHPITVPIINSKLWKSDQQFIVWRFITILGSYLL